MTIAPVGDGGHGSAVSLPQNDRSPLWAMEDTAVPFPYPKTIRSPLWAMEDTAVPFPYPKMIGYNHRAVGDGGHGSAVSLPQNDRV